MSSASRYLRLPLRYFHQRLTDVLSVRFIADCYIHRDGHYTPVEEVGAINICRDNIEVLCTNAQAGRDSVLEFYVERNLSNILDGVSCQQNDEHCRLYCSCQLDYHDTNPQLKPALRLHHTLCGNPVRLDTTDCYSQLYQEYFLSTWINDSDREHSNISVQEARGDTGPLTDLACRNIEGICANGWVNIEDTPKLVVSVTLDTDNIDALDFPGDCSLYFVALGSVTRQLLRLQLSHCKLLVQNRDFIKFVY